MQEQWDAAMDFLRRAGPSVPAAWPRTEVIAALMHTLLRRGDAAAALEAYHAGAPAPAADTMTLAASALAHLGDWRDAAGMVVAAVDMMAHTEQHELAEELAGVVAAVAALLAAGARDAAQSSDGLLQDYVYSAQQVRGTEGKVGVVVARWDC
jgi:hypothetical protein